ncbi:MAG: hypothetical protein OHK0039_17750 [Bacteroidia bacterium]
MITRNQNVCFSSVGRTGRLSCLLASLLVLAVLPTAAQPQRCGTLAAEAWMQTQFPGEVPGDAAFERWLAGLRPTLRSDTLLTIPVVVHIVHDGDAPGCGNNLSAEQVWSQIEVLNEDFRRMAGTPGYNENPAGADILIEFCPAAVDPDGNLLPERGIDRIDRQQRGFTDPPYSINYAKQFIQTQTYWDPNRYMNIWTLSLANDFLGFAQMPNGSTLGDLGPDFGPATTDGVVITPSAFGRGGRAVAPYNQGRTTTHEVGHWLGLRHIWGDGPCGFDDYCEDTPEAADPHYDCPAQRRETCGSPDMYENYMDYTDDVCMSLFTACQRDRMRTVMSHAVRRAALTQSDVCQVPPQADFYAQRQFLCPGERLLVGGRVGDSTVRWAWTLDGGEPASSQEPMPTVRYIRAGSYDIGLTVENDLGSTSLMREGYILVDSLASGQAFRGGGAAGWAGWTVRNPDSLNGWSFDRLGVCDTGDLLPGIVLYDYTDVGQRDSLLSPEIDLSGYLDARLLMRHAYRPSSDADRDSLIIRASVNGGLSYPLRLLALAGPDLATGSAQAQNFVPTASDWCTEGGGSYPCIELPIGMLAGSARVRLLFETYNDFGNNLYLDDILVEAACRPRWDSGDPGDLLQYLLGPNPSEGVLNLGLFNPNPEPVQIEVFDLQGRLLLRSHDANPARDYETTVVFPSGAAPGLYLLRLRVGAQVFAEKVVLRP